jgi:hypothetical protein
MISGDIDNDNQTDIIVLLDSINGVDILFNDGNGQFTTYTISLSNYYMPYSISAADVDNDHQIDIVILDRDYNNIGKTEFQ